MFRDSFGLLGVYILPLEKDKDKDDRTLQGTCLQSGYFGFDENHYLDLGNIEFKNDFEDLIRNKNEQDDFYKSFSNIRNKYEFRKQKKGLKFPDLYNKFVGKSNKSIIQITALVGENGSGKTQLMDVINQCFKKDDKLFKVYHINVSGDEMIYICKFKIKNAYVLLFTNNREIDTILNKSSGSDDFLLGILKNKFSTQSNESKELNEYYNKFFNLVVFKKDDSNEAVIEQLKILINFSDNLDFSFLDIYRSDDENKDHKIAQNEMIEFYHMIFFLFNIYIGLKGGQRFIISSYYEKGLSRNLNKFYDTYTLSDKFIKILSKSVSHKKSYINKFEELCKTKVINGFIGLINKYNFIDISKKRKEYNIKESVLNVLIKNEVDKTFFIKLFDFLKRIPNQSNGLNNNENVFDIEFVINRSELLGYDLSDLFYQSKDSFIKINFSDAYVKNGTSKIKMSSLSSGELSFLCRMSQVFESIEHTKKYESKKHKDILIMIDEPDLYLHIRRQKEYIYTLVRIFSHFNGFNFHFIIATHSPFIVSDIPENNLLILEKGKDVTEKYVDYKKKKEEKDNKNSFAATTFDIVSTFMGATSNEGVTIGDFTKKIIDEYVLNMKELLIKKRTREKEYIATKDTKNKINPFQIKLDELQLIYKPIIEGIGDSVLREYLLLLRG